MPFRKLQTSAGYVDVNYQISTPSNADASAIDSDLPTILFLHGNYLGSVLFHNQLNDTSVRRFNCVSFDARGHGATFSSVILKDFGPAQAAEDAVLLLDALGIRQVHMFAVQMGTLTAMHIAMEYPDRCLSAHLLSPLAIQEPEEVQQGRREMCDCWEEGFSCKDGKPDAVYGALQLAFSNDLDDLAKAMVRRDLPYAVTRYTATDMAAYRTVFANFFTSNRRNYSKEGFSRVKCPVKLTYCTEDIAYTLEQSEDLLRLMQESGIQASLEQIPACHFGNVKNPAGVNDRLVEFIRGVVPSTDALPIPSQATCRSKPRLGRQATSTTRSRVGMKWLLTSPLRLSIPYLKHIP
ncbi:Alpha/Beta hydrolase protein, partial [Pterulicium gracile]